MNDHNKNASDFAFQLGKLMGTMSNLEQQGKSHPDIPLIDWNNLKDAINKVAVHFYKDKYEHRQTN